MCQSAFLNLCWLGTLIHLNRRTKEKRGKKKRKKARRTRGISKLQRASSTVGRHFLKETDREDKENTGLGSFSTSGGRNAKALVDWFCSAGNSCFCRVDCFYADMRQNRSRQEHHNRIGVFCFLTYFNTFSFDQNLPPWSSETLPEESLVRTVTFNSYSDFLNENKPVDKILSMGGNINKNYHSSYHLLNSWKSK